MEATKLQQKLNDKSLSPEQKEAIKKKIEIITKDKTVKK